MARATRSSTQHDKHESIPTPSKKRKRTSAAADGPIHKLPRIKDEQQDPTLPSHTTALVPLDTQHAPKILAILEMTDTQGLLDRIFPLPSDPQQGSYSLRALLKDSSSHPLWVLRTAVQHLFPISSHPRSRPSQPAAQQLRFCNLALSLLDQASTYSLPVPLSLQSILPSETQEDDIKPPSSRYALMQHLPSGDYWTSLSATSDLKDLPTGHAELVAVLPTPSTSAPVKPLPTLATYNPIKPAAPNKPLPAQRRVTAGAFLDYGIWASFAPTFDHDGEVVGRRELGQVVYGWETRKREREIKRKEWAEGRGTIVEVPDADEEVKEVVDIDAELDGLLPPEEVEAIKAALDSLELEDAVQELLDRNRKALQRLEELQFLRLIKDGGGSSAADEGSEEWDTAQGIMESLTILASLRPRSSSDKSEASSIVPPASVVRKLYRTLALEPSPGWHGTLPPTRTTALRDDSTVRVRPGVPAPAVPTATATTTPAPTTSTPTPVSATAPYTGYAYAYSTTQQQAAAQQQPYRAQAAAASYTPYKPGQTPAYYQSPYMQQQAQQQSYYGQQSYVGAATATGQQPYAAFSGWYGGYPAQMAAAAAAAGGTGSGRGTPQPGVAANAGTYGSFFGGAAPAAPAAGTPPPTAGRTPAVANTVTLGGKGYPGQVQQQPVWAGAYPVQGQAQQGATPTLPAHLRGSAVATPGGAYQQPQQGQVQGYYGTYQQPGTPAR